MSRHSTKASEDTHVRALVQQGFTLLEIMIAVVILAIVLGIGLPAMGDWIQNRQVNALAESVASGLRVAQSEAVQRNVAVDMVFTTSDVTSPSNPSTVTLTAGGLAMADTSPNWMVRVSGATTSAGFVQGKMGADGTENARFSGPAGVSFSPLGRLSAQISDAGVASVPTGAVVFRIVNPLVLSSTANRRCVFVSTGGAVRVCDPRVSSPDSRACVPPLVAADCPLS